MNRLLQFPAGQVDADTFVLTLPMAYRQEALALLDIRVLDHIIVSKVDTYSMAEHGWI